MTAAAPNANPVRTRPRCFRPGRVVQIRVTDFARQPGQAGLATLFGPTVDEAVADLVRRLGVPAEELHSRPQQLGDVAILRRMPDDAAPEFGPGTVQPVAFVDGLAQNEITEALAWLSRRRAA